ncbi:hypothetical protein N7516_003183 [Penicillium verrucosum]|uniref:uncharacterized protein n=1 Tax=Penicillium verrucosum TaxID=60171 RepID=UPI002544F86F|nr:uncharacterized protein N7516_003183 [Penicillium verrucosum]KAJ5943015.1 hypothetical protein N7516_003183 [Penicillium verrucosum]
MPGTGIMPATWHSKGGVENAKPPLLYLYGGARGDRGTRGGARGARGGRGGGAGDACGGGFHGADAGTAYHRATLPPLMRTLAVPVLNRPPLEMFLQQSRLPQMLKALSHSTHLPSSLSSIQRQRAPV